MKRLCWFGAFDPEYPRNRILRAGLARTGLDMVEARVREQRAFRRYPALAAAFGRNGMDADTLLVPEFRHKDMPLARALAGGRRLVFDPLVSRVDTLVDDWGLHAPGSGQARWNAWLDRWSLSLADVVLCDTWAHGALYQSLGVPPSRLVRTLVGAEDAFFGVHAPPDSGPIRVLYVGGFLPLHGVGTMLEACRLLGQTAGLPEYEVVCAGRGIEFEHARQYAERWSLRRVSFPGSVPYAGLPRLLEGFHIMLGAFGAGAKTRRVIPHKVYQGLAAGRLVVSGESEGVREVFDGSTELMLVPCANPAALAAALVRAITDPAERAQRGARGQARAREVATPQAIGAALRHDLEIRG